MKCKSVTNPASLFQHARIIARRWCILWQLALALITFCWQFAKRITTTVCILHSGHLCVIVDDVLDNVLDNVFDNDLDKELDNVLDDVLDNTSDRN